MIDKVYKHDGLLLGKPFYTDCTSDNCTSNCDGCEGDCSVNTYDRELKLDEARTPLFVPSIYSVELTAMCNNSCKGCGNVFAAERPLMSSMSVLQWQRILDKIGPHARKLKITGGEPTLHPHFTEIIISIAQRDIPFMLLTNARWQNPTGVIELIQNVPQCKGMLISLHGKDAFAHEAFTGTDGSFSETVANIRYAASSGVLVTASTVLTRYNVLSIETLVEFALGLGVKCVAFNRYLGNPLPELEPTEAELREAVTVIEKLIARDAPVHYGNPLPQCFALNNSTGCMAGLTYCTIDPWGNMRPCNHSPLIVGNLFDHSLSDLWQSEIIQQWRDMTVAECTTCQDYFSCGGGCRAMIELRNMQVDPLNACYLTAQQQPNYSRHLQYDEHIASVFQVER